MGREEETNNEKAEEKEEPHHDGGVEIEIFSYSIPLSHDVHGHQGMTQQI